MAIVTITQQLGSSGSEIAERLRDDLGFQYLDKAAVESELVKRCQFPGKEFEKFDEKKPGFWGSFSADKDRYLHCLKTVVYEFARQTHCIILDRGAQALFRDVPGVLQVRILAPAALRRERVKNEFQYDAQLAEHAIHQNDHERAGFHKYFFQIDWEDPTLYHLSISTDIFPVDAAVRLIKNALEVSGVLQDLPEKNEKLADLCLTQQVITQIKYIEKIPTEFLQVVVSGGAVILRGAAVTKEHIKRCETIALSIPGAEKVINEMRCVQNPYQKFDRRVEPLS